MKFIDSINIHVKAGDGGNGVVTFARARGRPKMGPDGGDGGIGGDVYFVGNNQINTLSAFRWKAIYGAEDGGRGGAKGCRGKSGEDLMIQVPLGTMVHDAKTGDLILEVLQNDEPIMIAKGGLRGLGNIHWLTSTHQAPEEYKPGGIGEGRELRLELKILADVGLAGFPNAGKSTLLSVISHARPKIADYPFTTLVPNLGVVDLGPQYFGDSVVVADVPGLIEGASEGRGLGLAFLRHLERTSLIAYVLDSFGLEQDPLEALAVLQAELLRYSPELASRRAIVIMSKIDLIDEDRYAELKSALEALGHEVLPLSAIDGRGIRELKFKLHQLVMEERLRLAEAKEAAFIPQTKRSPFLRNEGQPREPNDAPRQ